MSRQLIVLTAALAVHTAAVAVVARSWDPPPAPAAIAAMQTRSAPCQTVSAPVISRAEPAAPPSGRVTDAELSAGILMTDPTHGFITRGLEDRLIADPMTVGRGVRIVPTVRDGRPAGFKLYAIRDGSVADRVHFQNGDTLVSVNGFDLTTPDKALDAYTSLREASELEVSLIRKGAPMTLSLRVVMPPETR